MEAFDIARTNMVKNQILPSNITNTAFIDVIMELPKHIFIPENKQGISYIDSSLTVGAGRYILSPMIFAKMIEALNIKGDESVLDIACGTGYSSAIIANLCKKVVSVESNADLASKAHLNLNRLGISNVIIISNSLAGGHEEGGPYDIIIINGAVKEVPNSLFDQLTDNGRLVTIISKAPHSGSIVIYTKSAGAISAREVFDVTISIIEDF
jgi:protein-L-isoaspartate(D-aspartate) O-methyltransferase